jgi:predicted membrane-bound spermidine synthase
MTALLAFVFALSGGAGLVYESIWTRYLGLFVGHGAYAQLLVLVIFLGGMSAGALLVGRWSDRLNRPLACYAGIEALAGVAGLLFHPSFRLVTGWALDRLFPALGSPAAVLVAKWSLAALLILPQSILLGATFPLMSAALLRRPGNRQQAGRVLAILYFSNSLGAAIGVLLAGFWFVEAAGLPGTLAAAGIANLVVAAIAMTVSSRAEAGGHAAAPLLPANSSDPSPPLPLSFPRLRRLLVAVAFGTAVASFVYEIAWIRMLSLVLGSATHSFELMLSAFILGLALGSFWIRGRADRLADPLRALGLIQWAMGALAIATLPLYAASFRITGGLLRALDRTDAGWQLFNGTRYLLCLSIMLPATFCAGMTLPLITKILVRTEEGERAIGLVYGVNTLGSILGAGLGGLVLLPWLGLKWLLVSGALVDAGLGVAILAAGRESAMPALLPRRLPLVAGLAILAIALAFGFGVPLAPSVLTCGVYRYGWVPSADEGEIEFYQDGRTATVSIRRDLATGLKTLATNGKPDASLGRTWFEPPGRILFPLTRDESTQAMMPILLLAHHPEAKSAAVIGLGSGMSTHLLLGSPNLERVWTVEIESEIVRAAERFRPANRRVFEDPRSTIVVDDAKSHFAATGRRYDIVLSEPSNPWVGGVAGLFTTEFYSRAKRHLAPNGIFGQWLHLYEIDDDLVLTVLAAIHRSFRSWEIWFVAEGDLFVLASDRETLRSPDWSVVRWPLVAGDLARFAPIGPETLDGMRVGGRQLFAPLLDRAVLPNSDDFPWLELGAERARFLRSSAKGMKSLAGGSFDLAAALEGRRRPFGTSTFPAIPGVTAVYERALAASIRASLAGKPERAPEPPLSAALFRYRTLEALADSPSPLSDWHPFVDFAAELTRDLHAGSAGEADAPFFALLRRKLERGRAPDPARAAVDFLEGIAGWNWEETDRAGRILIPLTVRGERWLPPSLLRDGAAVAAIRLGREGRAAEIALLLEPFIGDSSPPLRGRLLAAHALERPEGGWR